MSPKHITKKELIKDWCPRCLEREEAPDPRVPLLNPKREKFCSNVAVLAMTKQEAYMGAGYSAKNKANATAQAGRLMRKLEITNRIACIQELSLAQDMKTREWVDDGFKEVVERCMQKKPVLDDKGIKIGEWTFNAPGANTALTAMGKARGMFVDKVEIVDECDSLTTKELMERVSATCIELGRDFVIQIGEKLGLKLSGQETEADGASDRKSRKRSKKSPGGSVPTVH